MARESTPRPPNQPDDDLLARFNSGDADAFMEFYRRHLAAVLAFFLRRTGDPELTADLTAEVFAAALPAAARYRPGERPALAWLYGIAAHKLADSRRRGRVEDAARRRLALEPLTIDDADLAHVEELAATVDQRQLDAAVDALPAAQRAAVVARVVQERPYAEIAAEMSCSELLVRQRVSRGLRTLRSQIKETG
jgi:RNA polymerase sigma factor (sigma-70 family)